MTTLAEWARFVSHTTESKIEYRTIEVWHPDIDRVYRYARGASERVLTLEDDAPRNPGEEVLFSPATLQITEPSEREDSEQALSVEFGNVDGTIHGILDQIAGSGYFTPVQIVYRKYYSGDLSRPAVPPLYLYASAVSFNGPESVTFTAEDVDLSQKRVGTLYTVELFPGLRE